jgi:hypothetical protein
MTCQHAGAITGDRVECHSPALTAQHGRAPLLVPVGYCHGCREHTALTQIKQCLTAWQHCIHRGSVQAQRPANLCGLRGTIYPVFGCAVHGECVTSRTCEKQRERLCYFCNDARG